jgi:anti-sigma regulatory factor (Ser/Thr protein kinase)
MIGRPVTDDELVISLSSTPHAPSLARQAAREFVLERPAAAPHVDALMLLISEAVTNAVTHPQVQGSGEIELSVAVTNGLTRVVVSDQGNGFAESRDPLEAGGSSGYGLILLDTQSDRWGTLNAPGRFSVWFEIDHLEAPNTIPEDEEPTSAAPPQP